MAAHKFIIQRLEQCLRDFLLALEQNQKGHLWSSDLPYFSYLNAERHVGRLVPEALKRRWTLDLSGDRRALPKIVTKVDKVDFFHYDSDKSYAGREFALQLVVPKLSEKGNMLIDDIQNNSHFRDYVTRTSKKFTLFEFENKYTGLIEI